MQFRVPQFIEVEDKIFGPFTFKQFLYIVGGAGICFVIYKTLPIYLAVLLIVPVGAFSGALAFYKVNNKPFIFITEAFFNYLFSSKLYLWKKGERKVEKKAETGLPPPEYVPRLSESKLKDLSWSLDVLDMNKGQEAENEEVGSRK